MNNFLKVAFIFMLLVLQNIFCQDALAYSIEIKPCLKNKGALLLPNLQLMSIDNEKKIFAKIDSMGRNCLPQRTMSKSSAESMCIIENEEHTEDALDDNIATTPKNDTNSFSNSKNIYNHPFADLAWPTNQLHSPNKQEK